MEEWVGLQWHRFVTRRAAGSPSPHAVRLDDVKPAVQLLLRAAGGHQRLALAAPVRVGGERGFWQRLAGSGLRQALPQLDDEALALPEQVAVFEDAALNRELYLWWAALAGPMAEALHARQPWAEANLAATRTVLQRFPGLAPRWARLRDAHLAQRQAQRPGDPAVRAAEAWLQAALHDGAEPAPALLLPQQLAPVWPWLLPCPPEAGADDTAETGASDATAPGAAADTPADTATDTATARARRRVQRPAPIAKPRAPLLLAPKGEWLKTFADPGRIERAHDDEDDGSASVAAEELEQLILQRSGPRQASRLRFDLDLPSASADDLPVGPGEPLPEWDPRAGALRPARVLAQTYLARDAAAWSPGAALRADAAKVRRRLSVQRAAPRWRREMADGEAIDLDAVVRQRAESGAAAARGADRLYLRAQREQRELATLLLADLSLSTDAHANDRQRVIDVIRDALYVFGEALAGSGDAFSVLGFSSVKRQLRLQALKGFDEPWGPATLARLGALKPGYYTRMGAALRAGTKRLSQRPERQRLLLLLTDGKPHDLDGYDGAWGQEDTRQAVLEARRAGLLVFALSIDAEAGEVMPRLFGTLGGRSGWSWVHRPEQLPQRLTGLYAQLTR